MVKYKLTRKGRLAVVYGRVSDIQDGEIGATMTQVARDMGLQPSTYLMDCLKELEKDGAIYCNARTRQGRGIVREWYVSPPWDRE